MTAGRIHVAVVGAGDCDAATAAIAEEVGARLADAGAVVVCGGLGGVMAGACRGARRSHGTTIGLLPGLDRGVANAWVDIAIPTGLGEARNTLVVRAADAVVAVGGAYGTLSEIAFALTTGVAVVGIATWRLARPSGPDRGIRDAADAREAVALALELAGQRRPSIQT